jgi:glycosyltransferase involved in cell wall biosynthesis
MIEQQARTKLNTQIVMLCTRGRGGMRAVVEGYREGGLFQRYPVRWLVTHDEGSAFRRLSIAVRAYLNLLAMLLAGRVATVHSHMAMRGSFWRKSLFNATARGAGVPVIAHLHGSEFKQFYAALSPRLQRRVSIEFERCHCVLVLSRSWAEFVRSIAPRAHVVEMPNHVRLQPPREFLAPSQGEDVVTVLFLGLVGDRKGVFDLLPALASALQAAPSLRLVIGGNGELDRARAMVTTLGLDKQVQLLGWVTGDQKQAALRSADVYVLPSHNEGLPVSILEAMSHGLPIVATRVGGIPELLRDGVDGLLLEPGDVPALASALVRLATQRDQRINMGQAARQRISEGYCDDVVLPRLYEVYDDALARRPPNADELRRSDP